VSALRLGPLVVDPPVVLAPMAGVTNVAFRRLCRRYAGIAGPGVGVPGVASGLFVSEMVMARAVVEGNGRTDRMLTFAPDEVPRSIQLYAIDPITAAAATRRLVDEIGAEHVDLNFGCPAGKVTRNGGGAAVPAKPALLAAIVSAVVRAAGSVPVTMKFRKGLDDGLTTFLEAGRVGAQEGCAAIALHARTAEQLYSGTADWDAIAELKSHVPSIPVLGNGDIWEARDATSMMARTGCDGVVVGRGCLGRPWLFGQLSDEFAGRPVDPPPALGTVMDVMREHAVALVDLFAGLRGVREFRKHAGWYVTGYPVGPAMRKELASVSTLHELEQQLARLDPAMRALPGAERIRRGHTNGPRPVRVPDGFFDPDWLPGRAGELAVSGG
jgi:nifR3 family TIM-barrel protein